MRRITMFNRVSADGYFSTPDGRMDWMVPDDEIDKGGAGSVAQYDTILFGRRTYQVFEMFWPHALDDSTTAPDPHSRRRTPEMRAMAVMLNESSKLVFSKTLKEATWKNSRLIADFDPAAIQALKSQPGKDIIVFGSGSIVSQLAQHGLIDEYQFVMTPLFLGSGKTLTSGMTRRSNLTLLDARPFQSGNVLLRYAPVN